ncbi:PH domain-containing protein [Arthrobacter sp. NPDC058127]|uniref:PH domain-containing protein n=1 Tax=Arthrobacter sp. NPDC058127 TaxID=3346351 RepID=UPI0036EA5CEC
MTTTTGDDPRGIARGIARVAETDVAGATFSAAVSRRAVTVWNITSGCTGLIACVVLLGFRLVFQDGWLAIVLVVLAVVTVASTVAECLIVNPRRALTFRYGVEPPGLSIAQGRWIRRETFVPRAQILYVRLRRGPVLRNFGLASVHVGVLGREFMVPCLDEQDAERLRGALKNVDRGAA